MLVLPAMAKSTIHREDPCLPRSFPLLTAGLGRLEAPFVDKYEKKKGNLIIVSRAGHRNVEHHLETCLPS